MASSPSPIGGEPARRSKPISTRAKRRPREGRPRDGSGAEERSLEEIAARPGIRELLDAALAGSVADETELLYLEVGRGEASTARRESANPLSTERSTTVRVADRGRPGSYVLERMDRQALEDGLRLALAHSRGNPATQGRRALPGEDETASRPLPGRQELFDPEIAGLQPSTARSLLFRWSEKGERAHLRWTVVRLLLVNSRGLVRDLALTGAELEVISGRGTGAGVARAAARTLRRLEPAAVVARARGRAAESKREAAPPQPPALLLAPEATAELVGAFNLRALSAAAFAGAASAARGGLGRAFCAPAVSLRDDGTDPAGLAVPFDFAGRTRRPVEMVARGVLSTPAVDAELAAELGLSPTPHELGPGEHRAAHLFLAPGAEPPAALLAGAAGGLWVSRLEAIAPTDPGGLGFRALAREVREIRGEGELGDALPDLLWEDDLLRVFRDVLALGAEPVTVAADRTLLESVSAPAAAVAVGGACRLSAGSRLAGP